MWSYNYTQQSDELYHYGIPGMKWGHRKTQVSSAKTAYRSAKKDYKQSVKDYRRSVGFRIGGINSISRERKARSKMRDAEMKMIDKKAKYNASKAIDKEGAKKAEFKTYRKEMTKSGIVGSVADERTRGRSEFMYNHLKRQKGKEYADAVQKKVQDVSVKRFVAGAAIGIGTTAVAAYLKSKGKSKMLPLDDLWQELL